MSLRPTILTHDHAPLALALAVIIAHLADLHLGYRAYHRMVQGGINARERDVALAFRSALDQLIAIKPDLIVIAGDIFHTVRPSNAAISDAFRQFSRVRQALPNTPVVMIAGNHDSPRSVETGSILRLFAEIPGIHVMDQDARSVHFENLGTTVTGVPHTFLASNPEAIPSPDNNADYNILLLHVDLLGEQKLRYISVYGGAPVDVHAIDSDRWSYVALGHYHIATEVRSNMWFAGGIERTSASIWEEREAKGFVTFDTDTRRGTFHEVETRPVIDLPRIYARADRNGSDEPEFKDAAAIDALIKAHVESIAGGIENKIVRLVIHDLPRELFRELDHRALRDYRAAALHFHIDARRPEHRRVGMIGNDGRRRTLEQEVEWFITDHWRPTSSEVDKPRLLNLAHLYLAEARGLEPRGDDGEELPEPVTG